MFNRCLFLFVLLLLAGLGVQQCQIQRKGAALRENESIAAAVTDSLHHYRDRLGREVSEKRGMQASLKVVEADYALLTANQRRLVADIQALPGRERRHLVASTTLAEQVRVLRVVDSVRVPSRFALVWRRRSDTLSYAIHVADSTLTIDSLTLPNHLTLVHYRDQQRRLRVRATNSNPMFRTQDLDALVPPEKRKGFLARLVAVFFPG